MHPSLSTNPYGVALVGDALEDAENNYPFEGRGGLKLTQLIGWAGLERGRFDIWNTLWCQPANRDDIPFEVEAVNHCRAAHWGRLHQTVQVIVPMGNVPLAAFTGRKGILQARGYVQPGPGTTHLVPTVHPSFIQKGMSKYAAAWIHDVQKAVELAETGLRVAPKTYTLDPTPDRALAWAREYRRALASNPALKLAYDIETPGKGEDEGENAEDDDPTYNIFRIGFSYAAHSALSIPWEPAFMAAIRILMESPGQKVVWNAGFDNPRIRAKGVAINGLVHDGMVAWHVLHSDLPKGLGFVATFTCPWQPAWKHLSGAAPAFYNATDADVEWQSMEFIERELRQTGLWDVYQDDVLDMEPILLHMHDAGMPLDPVIRADRAVKLDNRRKELLHEMESQVPRSARRVAHTYKKEPSADQLEGLFSRYGNLLQFDNVHVTIRACNICGALKPTKAHFRSFKRPTAKRPQNPCAGASSVEISILGKSWSRLADFTPSRDQLIRYQQVLGRPIPTKWDPKTKSRKISMDEKAIKWLMGKYPSDKLYPLVLEYREIDKVAGTYLGRPEYSDQNHQGVSS